MVSTLLDVGFEFNISYLDNAPVPKTSKAKTKAKTKLTITAGTCIFIPVLSNG
jgi:hypothetical protein